MNTIVLLHGRTDFNQVMDDWGFEGPTLRGVAWVHWTYGGMNVAFENRQDAERAAEITGWHWFDDKVLEMEIIDDLVVIRGNSGRDDPQFFGDFELQDPNHQKT